ncbi:MAG: hypothetical protein IT370_12295 [Deltaproteobacteria bacterium]|nr:hypothetical protein [Deltaproteobacteria bacterium]
MRMMLKVSIPTDAGNKAIVDGTLPKVIGQFMERHKPEGAYFTTYHGRRTMFAFVDMPDPSQMPVIGEPLFIALGAEIEVMPCMNAQELAEGVAVAAKNR